MTGLRTEAYRATPLLTLGQTQGRKGGIFKRFYPKEEAQRQECGRPRFRDEAGRARDLLRHSDPS